MPTKRRVPAGSAHLKVLCATALIVAMSWSVTAQQASGDIWRTFAQKLTAGTELTVRLQNGQRFAATLIDARADALVLQPRTGKGRRHRNRRGRGYVPGRVRPPGRDAGLKGRLQRDQFYARSASMIRLSVGLGRIAADILAGS